MRVGSLSTDPFKTGFALAKNIKKLDAAALEAGVKPLSSYGFRDDLDGNRLCWHRPVEGLVTLDTLIEKLEQQSIKSDVLADLKILNASLQLAATTDTSFCLHVRMGSIDHEHPMLSDKRKGSYF